MSNKDLIDSVAYCGLVCGVCAHASKGCIGCRSGRAARPVTVSGGFRDFRAAVEVLGQELAGV